MATRNEAKPNISARRTYRRALACGVPLAAVIVAIAASLAFMAPVNAITKDAANPHDGIYVQTQGDEAKSSAASEPASSAASKKSADDDRAASEASKPAAKAASPASESKDAGQRGQKSADAASNQSVDATDSTDAAAGSRQSGDAGSAKSSADSNAAAAPTQAKPASANASAAQEAGKGASAGKVSTAAKGQKDAALPASGDSAAVAAGDDADKSASGTAIESNQPQDAPDATAGGQLQVEFPAQVLAGNVELASEQGTAQKLAVTVDAPEGALPDGAAIKLKAVDPTDYEAAAAKALKRKAGVRAAEWQAVDIEIIDNEGNALQPAVSVELKLASNRIAEALASVKSADDPAKVQPRVIHIDAKGKAIVIDTLTERDLANRGQKANPGELVVDADSFSPYLVAFPAVARDSQEQAKVGESAQPESEPASDSDAQAQQPNDIDPAAQADASSDAEGTDGDEGATARDQDEASGQGAESPDASDAEPAQDDAVAGAADSVEALSGGDVLAAGDAEELEPQGDPAAEAAGGPEEQGAEPAAETAPQQAPVQLPSAGAVALGANLLAAAAPLAAAADAPASYTSNGVTYSVYAPETTAVAGETLPVTFTAQRSDTSGADAVARYFYVVVDEDQATCEALDSVPAGGVLTVPTSDGVTATLWRTNDGFFVILGGPYQDQVSFTLDFTTKQTDDQEPEEASAGIFAGAADSWAWAAWNAQGVRNLVKWGWADKVDPATYALLNWTAEEEDPEPVMADEFTASADEIYGYFHTPLPTKFHAQAGRGSENNVFYVRQSADRSLAALLKDAQPGTTVPAVNADGEPICDRYGTQLQFHVTEDGFWFELDNSKHNNFADFELVYQAAEDASAVSSNAAKMRLYLNRNASDTAAQEAAAQKFSPDVSLTWSDSGDKLHYAIKLLWDTAIEDDKYDQEVVTTSQSTLHPKYILDVLTSSVNYDPGKFEMRLPYALWAYRGSANGSDAAVPSDLSIPKEGTPTNGSMFQYRIEYDPAYPNDKTKAQLVITNCEYLPAGTNARISVKFDVDPWKTVDLSKSEIAVLATAQATSQKSPEYGESNTITYRLDTGFDSAYLKKTSTWTSMEAACVYSKPSGMKADNWDPDHYNMVKYHISYGVGSSYNQPLTYDFLATLPEGAELVAVTPHTGSYKEIPIDSETGTWTRTTTSKSTSSSDGDYWFYVRYPRTGPGDAEYRTRLDMDVTASDPDSHTPPEDYNDKDHKYLEWDFTWHDYVFVPPVGVTETHNKSGWGDDYIEAVRAGKTDIEFNWRMYATNLRWNLDDGETQYIQATDDAHFWTYVPKSYSTNDWRKASDMHWMDGDSYEFSRISSIRLNYYDVSHRDGSTIYPDFAGGTLAIQGSKDGKTWNTIETLVIAPATQRTGASISVPDYGKVTIPKGSGYTRLRVITPEVGRGSLTLEVDFYTRMKGESALIQKWIDECDEEHKVYIRNYAAYQHFTREFETETVTDPDTGEQKTVKTDKLGDPRWDDYRSSANGNAAADGVSDGQTLTARDAAENQYVDGTPEGYLWRAYANGQLRHIPRAAAIKKETGQVVNDSAKQRAIVPFSLIEEESIQSVTGSQYDGIYQDFSQDSGVFYDLLPIGYRYMEGSAWAQTVLGKDVGSFEVETIDDYRGSGRQMVVFRMTKPADPANYSRAVDTNIKTTSYSGYIFGKTKETQHKPTSTLNPYTGFRVEFQTYIPWKELVNHPTQTNLVAFQRTDGKPITAGESDQGYPSRQSNFPLTDSQIIKEFKGTAAKNRAIDYDKSTTADFDAAFAKAGGVRGSGPGVFTDVDGDGQITPKSTLYAYSTANPQVVDGVQTGIDKRVLGDEGMAAAADGDAAGGWNKLDRTTLLGSYQYKITARASMGEMKGLIVYDTLEDAKNKEGAEGEVTWKGTFDSVDVSEARALGFDPVVYYSTVKGLDYNTITGDEEFIWIADQGIWSTELPADKSAVTAVAVDFRKMADGGDSVLRSRSGDDDPDIDQVSFIINMTAPKYFPSDPEAVYAINRPAYSCYQKGFFSAEGVHKNDIGLRVKISLPISVRVHKVSIGGQTPANASFVLECPNGYQYPFKYKDFDEDGYFTFDDAVLAKAPAKDKRGVAKPDRVKVGDYRVTEDAESAQVGDKVPVVTYDRAGGMIGLAGKTTDAGSPVDEQNVITVTNRYAEPACDFTIVKVDATDHAKTLAGAQFELRELDPEDTGAYVGDSAAIDSAVSGRDGVVAFEQVAPGYYECAEVATPEGYVITDGGAVYLDVREGGVRVLSKTAGAKVKDWPAGDPVADNAVVVENQPGTALPNTGGRGSAPLYAAGFVLVALGLVLVRRYARS